MRPRHALAAAAILTAVTLGSWAALSTDNHTPTPQAAGPTSRTRHRNTRRTDRQQTRRAGRHHAQQARRLQAPVLCATPGRPAERSRQDLKRSPVTSTVTRPATSCWPTPSWTRPASLASGTSARCSPPVISPTWRWPTARTGSAPMGWSPAGPSMPTATAVTRVPSPPTGGASNDAYNLFGLAGCQLRQVRVAGAGGVADPGRRVGWPMLKGSTAGHRPARPTPTHPLGRRAGQPATRWRLRLHLHQDQLPLGRQQR